MDLGHYGGTGDSFHGPFVHPARLLGIFRFDHFEKYVLRDVHFVAALLASALLSFFLNTSMKFPPMVSYH